MGMDAGVEGNENETDNWIHHKRRRCTGVESVRREEVESGRQVHIIVVGIIARVFHWPPVVLSFLAPYPRRTPALRPSALSVLRRSPSCQAPLLTPTSPRCSSFASTHRLRSRPVRADALPWARSYRQFSSVFSTHDWSRAVILPVLILTSGPYRSNRPAVSQARPIDRLTDEF